MVTWVNGRILSPDETTSVSAEDPGFLLGLGVFETLSVNDGQPFALSRHLGRLAAGARTLRIPAPDEAWIRDAVAHLTPGVPSGVPSGRQRLRITWTGSTLALMLTPAPPPVNTTLTTSTWVRNDRSPAAGAKVTSRALDVLAQREAVDSGASDAVLANTAGLICECTTANIFYVIDGQLRTPTLASGCLPGVTRALVLEWYGAAEADAPLAALGEASEVFTTTSLRGIQPVTALDGRAMSAPGPTTRAVSEVFERRKKENPDP